MCHCNYQGIVKAGLNPITQTLRKHSGPFFSFYFLCLPFSNSSLLSSRAPGRMAAPSVLQTVSRLHYKNTPGPKPELMSILDHLEEERIFLALDNWTSLQIRIEAIIFSVLSPNHSNSWNSSTFIVYLMPNVLMKSEIFSQFCEFFVLKCKSSATWQRAE